ncbi:amastin-like surface protein-like protein [Leishmania panamensis]|uniref:Amastin-like surface protein-like protein n=2 Tax=Leishmania guyanensis species complex TaxID=38579 RepID=A0A088RWL3_LEIPA|nr:amastin-like surface protein-like protein [Leishmania panamensis]AIO00326.1 amastin-like surface protein-like protein [Leishmania panamensis]CCM17487.1 Putative amastin-like surface protein-like protein [Leishmania guyanensis]
MAKKSFYDQEYRKHSGAVMMLIASFVALVFATCGTPLGMLMIRSWEENSSDSGSDLVINPCYTLWGVQNRCGRPYFARRITDPPIINCSDIHTRFEAAEAFSVLAIFSLFGVLGGSWYKICGSNIKTTVMMLSVFTIAFTTVPWATVTAFYYTPFCGQEFLTNKQTRFGAGYALLVASFAVQIVGLILFVIFEPNTLKMKLVNDEKDAVGEN